MTSRLAERLKLETRALHSQAERTDFMATLLHGRMDRASYARLLGNLHAIYAALEPALRRLEALPNMALFDLPALARTQALSDDLAAIGSTELPADSLVPACHDYVAYLKDLEAARPDMLLAHAYVRYLGDLSGGQMLRRIVARSMQLPDDAGTAFYAFGDPAATAALTRRFRAGVDALRVDEDAFVSEAQSAFERHCRLFEELALVCATPPYRAAAS